MASLAEKEEDKNKENTPYGCMCMCVWVGCGASGCNGWSSCKGDEVSSKGYLEVQENLPLGFWERGDGDWSRWRWVEGRDRYSLPGQCVVPHGPVFGLARRAIKVDTLQ